MLALPRVPDVRAWSLMLVSGAAALLLGWRYGFSIDPKRVLIGLAIVGAMLGAAALYTGARPEPKIASALGAFAFILLFPMVMAPLSYVSAAVAMPLQDAILVRLDTAIGFHWPAVHAFTFEQAWLMQACFVAYANAHYALIGAWVVLVATAQYERLRELAAVIMTTSVAGLVIAAAFPVVGAYGWYDVSGAMLESLKGTGAGQFHIADLLAVREGTLRHLDYRELQGIVQMPSFHTISAVVALWATWRTRWVRWPMVVVNVFVVFTALPIGGHHLMDILGGIALVAVAVPFVRWWGARLEARRAADAGAPGVMAGAGQAA